MNKMAHGAIARVLLFGGVGIYVLNFVPDPD